MAAREELSLQTRDACLRENDEGAGATFDLRVDRSGTGTNLKVTVLRVDGQRAISLWASEDVILSGNPPLDYPFIASVAEEMSRVDFSRVLREAGLRGTPATTTTSSVPPEIVKRLAALNVVDQYAAARELHRLLHAEGQSAERLAALVRAYSHLSLLTQSHWNISHKAFLARALLYARRLEVNFPEAASARGYSAYPLALAGIHWAALNQCDAIRAQAGESLLTGWLGLIESTCGFDNAALERIAEGQTPQADMAALMRLVQCESGNMGSRECLLADALMRRQPSCTRLLALLSREAPISRRHTATREAPVICDRALRTKVITIPDLPDSVSRAIKAMKPQADEPASGHEQDWKAKRVAAYRAMIADGAPGRDPGEPSWSVLGRLIEEEFFVAAVERMWFVKKTLGRDPSNEAAWALPLLPDHPFRGYLELCGIRSGEEKRHRSRLIGGMHVIDPDIQMTPMLREIRVLEEEREKSPPATAPSGQARPRAISIFTRRRAAEDHMVRDLKFDLDLINQAQATRAAHELLAVSPKHPAAAAELVQNEWKSIEAEFGEWEKRFGDHAVFVRAAAQHHSDAGELDSAEKQLKRLIQLEPDIEHFRRLAALYKKRGDPVNYVATLKNGLEAPDLGLIHARVRAELANYYMEQGEYATALPYAERAAESNAGDTVICLSRCYEGLGDLKRAEKCIRKCAERYRMSGYMWFFWCKRTGFGDVEAARRWAEECLVSRDRNQRGEGEQYGVYLLLTGESLQALDVFRKEFELNKVSTVGLHCALLALKAGNRGACREMLDRVAAQAPADSSPPRRGTGRLVLARLLASTIASDGPLDSSRIELILQTAASEYEEVDVNYFAARFLEAQDREADARHYLLRAARSKDLGRYTCILACDRCRQLGLEVAPRHALDSKKP